MSRFAVEVHVVDLRQPPAVVAALERLLDPRERDAARDRRTWDVRRRSIVAHAARRRVLAHRLGVAPGEVVFTYWCAVCGGPHGKALVVSASALDCSLAHSGEVALVAVAEGASVGIDVEVCRARHRLDRLAARTMTAAEHAAWAARPERERLPAFLDVWTAKEAYLKATGVGLTRPLRGVSSVAPPGWSFVPLEVSGCVATVAVAAPDAVVDTSAWIP